MNERAINSRLKVTLQRIHENLIAEPEPEMEGHHQLVSFVCKSHRGYSNIFVKYVFYFTSEVDNIYILNKSENATLQLPIFYEKVLDKQYLLKLNNVAQTSSKRFV